MRYGPEDIVFRPGVGAWYIFFIALAFIFVLCLYYVFSTGGVRVEDADYNAAVIIAMITGVAILVIGPMFAVAYRAARYVFTETHLTVSELMGPGFPRKVTREIAYASIIRVEEKRPGFWYMWFISLPFSLKQIKITYTEVVKGMPKEAEAFVSPKDMERFFEMLRSRLPSKSIIMRNDSAIRR